ncbi:type II toxin-antitoxin system PemK/MazF family toxin [Paenibacillus odorifer]|uniref:type II toxin-antitoxin system PemK/MazF family toxin n=1 Tax=Paenibacillus odorifer TaxID=189426 RepID=UPI00096E6B68|nr:type II toxin-antitoxin system PemK/MazF family toxin [Paenibacillus odorifer]OMD75294.1 hypothetical protein BSK50_19025 [Paenibacillus odorifer]
MRDIDNDILKTILRNKQTKGEHIEKHPSLNLQLLNSLSNQWKFSEGNIRAYETALWIKSQKNLIGNKGRENTKSYPPKTIVYVDLGNNTFGKEFSYLHPCVIIHNEHKKVFVVPCTSQPARRDRNGVTFSEYLEGRGGNGGDGFSVDTTVLLNEARYIDKTRITDKLGTVTDIFYRKIYDKLFQRIFESKSYTLQKLQELKNEAEINLQEANREIVRLNLELAQSFIAAGEGETTNN